jgi:hypothetical protein
MDNVALLKVLESIEGLKGYIKTLNFEKPKFEYSSVSVDALATALAKARLGFDEIGANKKSVDKSYADLPHILSKVNKGLGSNGLAFIQYTTIEDDESTILVTKLMHSSGQWIASRLRLILGETDKGNDRTLQINKRMQALALLGIWPIEDVLDDGGDQEMEDKITAGMFAVHETSTNKSKEVLTKEQYAQVLHELEGWPAIAKGILQRYDIQTLKDMPKENFISDVERIRKLKIDLKKS